MEERKREGNPLRPFSPLSIVFSPHCVTIAAEDIVVQPHLPQRHPSQPIMSLFRKKTGKGIRSLFRSLFSSSLLFCTHTESLNVSLSHISTASLRLSSSKRERLNKKKKKISPCSSGVHPVPLYHLQQHHRRLARLSTAP